MLKLILLFIPFTSIFAEVRPEKYEENYYAIPKIETIGEKYFFTYPFKDHKGKLHKLNWSMDINLLNDLSGDFGVSSDLLKPFSGDDETIRRRNSLFTDGMFIIDKGTIFHNYLQIVFHYRVITRPLYMEFKRIAENEQYEKWDFLDMVLKFSQDMPYGIPPNEEDGTFTGGLLPPTLSLKKGWGDCDTKAVLMASILSHHPHWYNRVAIIQVPGHALMGVNEIPRPYQNTIDYFNKKYIVLEPVGLERSPIGTSSSPYTQPLRVDLLNFDNPLTEAAEQTVVATAPIERMLEESDCPDEGLLIKFKSGDDTRAECQIKKDGNYINHGPSNLYDGTGKLLESKNYINGNLIEN